MTLFEAIYRRQAVRAYRPDPIPDEVLAQVMEAGRWAPSGGNGQNWRFGIVSDPALRAELADAAGKQDWIASAPVIIACCGPLFDPSTESDFIREVNRLRWGAGLDELIAGSDHPEAVRMLVHNANTLIPGTHIQLAAAAHGLGTCWIGFLDVMRVGRALNLPADWRCYFLITLGYPAEPPERRSRKPLAEITFADHWEVEWAPAATSPELAGATAASGIIGIIDHQAPPAPWAEGGNIPWNEPGFSSRMLKVHLSQKHDTASRRFEVIDGQVAWIHSQVMSGRTTPVLDLMCGPGLYSHRLAKLGHRCVGIDFSPASIDYARTTAEAEGLNADFTLGDIRTTEFGSGYDLAMFLYCEFNVFNPNQARDLLRKAYDALNPGGRVLLEVASIEEQRRQLVQPTSWYGTYSGLFSDKPHLVLIDVSWDEPTATKTVRHHIIDAATGAVEKCAATYQTYTEDQYLALFADAGFVDVQRFDGMGSHVQSGFIVLVAAKPE